VLLIITFLNLQPKYKIAIIMNKKIKLQVFLYALLALLIPFFAWSRGEEIKVERKLPVAKYVAKGGVGELSNQNIIH
jgi:hypothetical protein